MIELINLFNKKTFLKMVALDPKCLIYGGCFIYFPFHSLRSKFNAVVTVQAIEHWLL